MENGIERKIKFSFLQKSLVMNKLKRCEESVAAIEQAIGIDPELALFRRWKHVMLRKIGRTCEASAAYVRPWNWVWIF